MLIQRRSARRRDGVHTVEMAMVLPAFFLFFFGLIEISRGFMVSSLLVNASRIGCRTATLPGKTNDDVATKVDTILAAQGIANYTTTIKVNGTATTSVDTAATGDTVTVEVQVPSDKVSWIPKASFIFGNITGHYNLPHE